MEGRGAQAGIERKNMIVHSHVDPVEFVMVKMETRREKIENEVQFEGKLCD